MQLHPDAITLLCPQTRRRIEFLTRRLARLFPRHIKNAEDHRQDAVLELLRAFPKYDPDLAPLSAFVRGVLSNWYMHTARTLRRDRDRGVVQLPERDGEPFDIVDPSPCPLAAAGERMDLEAALASLPREERWLAEELKYKSVAEIAEDAGVHRGTVYRKLASLRAIWPENTDANS